MKALVLVLTGALAACEAVSAVSPDPMAEKVNALVNNTVNSGAEAAAFAALEELGADGIPYIVAHLNDVRPLPVRAISLENHSAQAFETLRHYRPETVHDALAAILNQMSGVGFEFVYNGAPPDARRRNVAAWRKWCVASYPKQASVCTNGI